MNDKRQTWWLAAFITIVLLFSGCKTLKNPVINVTEGEKLEVHLIDVGQGDAIFIRQKDATMLIDAGENNQGNLVVEYLQKHNVSTLDYVIGTHPHSDHIGGLDTVLEEYPTQKVILPNVMHTTKTFEEVLLAVKNQGLKITKPVVGATYELGDAKFTIIAPNSEEYEDLNDYSVGIKLEYGKSSFIFTGDADTISEDEMIHNGIDLSADVLKLAHHGSSYSNTKEFLDAVSPTIAIISVGKDNQYGHPHKEVLEDMKKRGIELYRTDLSGSFVLTSDGEKISVQTKRLNEVYEEKASGTSKEDGSNSRSEPLVYKTVSGTKYHEKDCSYLNGSSIAMTLKEAKKENLEACSRCSKKE